MANKLLGQHFLKNRGAAGKIVAAVGARPGDTIIEIGPGHGELTRPLAATGARVIAIEKDGALAEQLDKTGIPNLEVIAGDVLTMLPALAADGGKLVGNLPYYLTGHLLRLISELETKPARCVFMVQKEVALRMTAAPPHMNRLAASVQFWAEPDIVANLPKSDFSPQPKVDSTVVQLEAKPAISDAAAPTSAQYYAAVRILFSQPRKTLLNNLTAGRPRSAEFPKDDISKILEALGANPQLRPQNLTVGQIGAIAKAFF
ncbi:MAG TPA: 16S rRNA (adenine(1518)-N(6)/adenine(1519)-N(6))-dimethyltransferase RsmA [Candidatus Paceibacterota bacterium]|nr:16S rRNA (adenine(1518)-N(6)/adenine(1519)-N(6))-dimethyltransferase RsmA [Candidatus Paceibacterota bacterium]